MPDRDQNDEPATIAVRASRGAFVAVALFSLFHNLLLLTVPLYMLQIYDRVLTSGSEATLMMLTIVAFGMLLASALLELVRSRVLTRLAMRLDDRLNANVLAATHRLRLDRVQQDGQPLIRDLDIVRAFFGGNGLVALLDIPWTPVFIVVIFLFHPLLGWIALGGAVLLCGLGVLNELATRKPLREALREHAKGQTFAETSLQNGDVVEAMAMLPGIHRRWRDHHERSLLLQTKLSDRLGTIAAFAKFARQGLQIAMLGLGAYLALQQVITAGVMIAASIILARALAPVELSIMGWRGFVQARESLARLRKAVASATLNNNAMRLPKPTGHIAVEHLFAAPPGVAKPVLQNVTCNLQPGQILGVIGPSAAGKSTLARVLVGVWQPKSGHVRLDNADIATWDRRQLGPCIGYLPQDVELFDGSIKENIARFELPVAERIVAAARRAGVHDMILGLPNGYNTRIGDSGCVLSGGQRQRVALARALYGDPVLIVLDEPNANLDSDGDHALRCALEALKAEQKTVVIISHRLNVLAVADQLMLLRDGSVERSGPRAEVLAALTRVAASQSVSTARDAAAAE
ncbi:MAG: type I secretion system permease/ATPase [Minwuiales bacterium]|nr:type I secretion system permease/ATPase [Minwuiales bacterium]